MLYRLSAVLFALTGVLLLSGPAIQAQSKTVHSPKRDSVTTIGEVVRTDARMNQLVPVDARIEVVASGFGHIEGPVWVRDSLMLLFSDSENQTIYRWSPSKGVSAFLKQTGYTGRLPYSKESGTNGLAINAQGDLLICEHGDRRIARLPMAPKGGKRTLVDNFEGKRFNSPNDILVAKSGSVYFTDPPYGLPKKGTDSTRETPFSGVYQFTPAGQLSLVVRDMAWPNGLALSPDQKTLYITESDSLNSHVRAFPVQNDGQLGKGKLFFDVSKLPRPLPTDRADGLKVDQSGNVWATGYGGVLVISPTGELLGHISTGETIANVAWGDDGSTLYIASGSYLCRIRTSVKGW